MAGGTMDGVDSPPIAQVRARVDAHEQLIADVVTGKLDVREAASQLPEEGDDHGPGEANVPLLDLSARQAGDTDDDVCDGEASAEEYAIEREVTV